MFWKELCCNKNDPVVKTSNDSVCCGTNIIASISANITGCCGYLQIRF